MGSSFLITLREGLEISLVLAIILGYLAKSGRTGYFHRIWLGSGLADLVCTLTGIAFLSHQAGSFLGAWGGGYLFDLMGSYDLAWKIGVLVGLAAGTMQLLMNDRPTDRVLAAQAQPA